MITPAEFEDTMMEIAANGDPEQMHSDADDLMCAVLIDLGYAAGIRVFDNMELGGHRRVCSLRG